MGESRPQVHTCSRCGEKMTVFEAHFIKHQHNAPDKMPIRVMTDSSVKLCARCARDAETALIAWEEGGMG